MTTRKPLPPAQPYDDEPEDEPQHSADEVQDDGPLESLGQAVSEAVLGAEGAGPTPASATGTKSRKAPPAKPSQR